jgi:hypothetical protein
MRKVALHQIGSDPAVVPSGGVGGRRVHRCRTVRPRGEQQSIETIRTTGYRGRGVGAGCTYGAPHNGIPHCGNRVENVEENKPWITANRFARRRQPRASRRHLSSWRVGVRWAYRERYGVYRFKRAEVAFSHGVSEWGKDCVRSETERNSPAGLHGRAPQGEVPLPHAARRRDASPHRAATKAISKTRRKCWQRHVARPGRKGRCNSDPCAFI